MRRIPATRFYRDLATVIPIALDPTRVTIAVAGDGPAASRRRRLLTAAGTIVIALPTKEEDQPAGDRFVGIDLLWIADLPLAEAAALAGDARAAGVLVNVEDRPELSDFHSVAELRRGALLIGVSTAGQSPGLARRIRDRIAELIGPEWSERVDGRGAARRRWRSAGKSAGELAALTDAVIDDADWLR